jgi:hypothetical protein
MIPSLVVGELRSALVEYLSSTFALSDDDVREELSRFLEDSGEGIFRGPYLRVRTPIRSVEEDWTWPLQWVRDGFVPHQHQATAFERLSTLDGRTPSPTLVTTGTGSGKTECFLYPVLDHCARMQAQGKPGVKALILYPMNALASDQAGRIAELIASQPDLAGVTAGIYVGNQGRHSTMGPDHLVDKREILRADPPDILLTNYKMLDFLLLRREDRDLWAVNEPNTLRYVVLDEFHTYDGAQGTDVAMLLRRLGRTLQMAAGDAPLGTATPVATSATLGVGDAASQTLRDFAGKVFGVDFEPTSVIGESRQTVEEACDAVDYTLPIPEVADVAHLDDLDEVAAAFCAGEVGVPEGPVDLGRRLLKHPLTRAVLAAVGERARTWQAAVEEIVTRAPTWGATLMRDPVGVERALGRYLWLLSVARRQQGERLVPLFSVDVQLWIREVSRLLRAVATDPAFRWQDAGTDAGDEHGEPVMQLPAAYCRRCGMSGWIARQQDNSSRLSAGVHSIYTAAVQRSGTIRVLLRTQPEDPNAVHLDPATRTVEPVPSDVSVPVLVTGDEQAAAAQTCPACAERDTIRFLGLRTASLASVSINTLFASPNVAPDEQKLLVFTDSVQDASHRAAFFSGRTHRINLRSRMAHIVADAGSISVADLGVGLIADATSPRDRFALVPPDLLRHPKVRTVWSDAPDKSGLDVLARRIGFEVDLEFGLRSRVGRTLELSRVAVATVEVPNWDEVLALIAEDLEHHLGDDVRDLTKLDVYVAGLLERLRQRGGLHNPLLDPYLSDNGRLWHVWGGRPDGLPPFTPGQGRPLFFTTAPQAQDFDSTNQAGATPTWLVDWADRCLGLDGKVAAEVNTRVFSLLADQTDTVRTVGSGTRTFALDRQLVIVHDVVDEGPEDLTPAAVRCDLCGYRHPVPTARLDLWTDAPCIRYRCAGHFEIEQPRLENYYRRLYREGQTRRVVTAEHTGLLKRHEREDLERAFKDGSGPADPNVVAATPTLEMGIDIGDLSSVMLANVPRSPASYVQRVGRAGRATGNSLITTFVGTDTHGLYYLSSPEAMIAGEVRPPDCYLDAIDTLKRQYVAFLIDRIADLSLEGPPIDRRMAATMQDVMAPAGLFGRLIAASTGDQAHIDTFLGLFGSRLTDDTVERLREFAGAGIEAHLKSAAEMWLHEERELGNRRTRLSNAIEKLDSKSHRSPSEEEDLSRLRGERQASIAALRRLRDDYSLSGLERLGLLPNYTLLDDSTTLEATTWWRDDDGNYESDTVDYVRPARLAVRELAPGNWFYVGGHRHKIDALDVGEASEPSYETWRLCPECGYGRVETPDSTVLTQCPRCASPGIADAGVVQTMLRLKRVFASSSEEQARVFDETDERDREQYDVVTTVDADPTHISQAWKLTEQTFGAERSGRTHIRTINLGFQKRHGDKVTIAGGDRHATRFNVCPHCGAVADVRDDRDGERPERLHQGWCVVRRGTKANDPDRIVLYHELTTEAVRLVLPVSLFEVEERLVSFTGALMLGLREDFGGELDHLSIIRSEAPNRSGQGRRRFLVLYDDVPGGTGYLSKLGDAGRMKAILDKARELIATCQCQSEARAACHRCLLGVVERRDYEHASRKLALELLDDLLAEWQVEKVATIADLDMGKVEESELERRFKVALQDWTAKLERERRAGVDHPVVTLTAKSGKSGRDAFELRFGEGAGTIRYRIEEQEGVSTTPNTVPDFLIKREDATGREVAVYLDGYQFHASAEHNNLADDARKRAGVRAGDKPRLVWNLTWNDVADFHKAALSESSAGPAPRPLLTGPAQQAALHAHHAKSGALDFRMVDRNPLRLLLDYLLHPEDDAWERLAVSAVTGGAASGGGLTAVALEDLRDVLSGLSVSSTPDAEHRLVCFSTQNGLWVDAVLRPPPNDERWSVIAALPDAAEDVATDAHRARWHDWLQWANVLQFLDSHGRQALIGTTSMRDELLVDLLVLDLVDEAEEAATAATAEVELDGEVLEELDLLTDEAVLKLVRTVLERGAGKFVAGFELPEGELVEAAWPAAQVGVLMPGEELAAAGWDLRPVDRWNADDLTAALSGTEEP